MLIEDNAKALIAAKILLENEIRPRCELKAGVVSYDDRTRTLIDTFESVVRLLTSLTEDAEETRQPEAQRV